MGTPSKNHLAKENFYRKILDGTFKTRLAPLVGVVTAGPNCRRLYSTKIVFGIDNADMGLSWPNQVH